LKPLLKPLLKPIVNFIHQVLRILGLSALANMGELARWVKLEYSSPAPRMVKESVLRRWGGRSIWIESGTHLGFTSMFLSEFAESVHTIEPQEELFKKSIQNFEKFRNINSYLGTSEKVLPRILQGISEASAGKLDVSFWLDGHFSQNDTYQGSTDTSIIHELKEIEKYIGRFHLISLLVDDIRLFRSDVPMPEVYPNLNILVDWATKHGLYWTIELDIFIATNRKLVP